MEITIAGRAVPEERTCESIFLAILARPRQASCVQHLRSDGDRQGCDAQALGDLVAAFIAHPMQKYVFHGQTAPKQPGIFSVTCNQSVVIV